jgi:hypothetical protein
MSISAYRWDDKKALVMAPNSHYWKSSLVKEFDYTTGDRALGYLRGMGGYLISLVWRICGLAKDTLMLLKVNEIKKRGPAFFASIFEVGTAVVGVICPPLAYRLDEWIQRFETVRDCSIMPEWGELEQIRNQEKNS